MPRVLIGSVPPPAVKFHPVRILSLDTIRDLTPTKVQDEALVLIHYKLLLSVRAC